MVSVSDSLGAITNITQIVEINLPEADFSTQIENIKNTYENAITVEENKQIQILNILSNEISRLKESNCTKSNCSGNGKCNPQDYECTCNSGYFSSDCSL